MRNLACCEDSIDLLADLEVAILAELALIVLEDNVVAPDPVLVVPVQLDAVVEPI